MAQTVTLLATKRALKYWTRAYFVNDVWCTTPHMCVVLNWKHADISTPDGNPKLKVKSWKTIFFKSRAENILYVVNKKNPTVSMEDICWGEGGRFFSMLFWLKQTIPQSKPNFPLYAKYVPHHPTDRCNYMTVDVRVRMWRPEFNPSVTEPMPTCSSLILLSWDGPLRRTNQEQGSLFGEALSCSYHCRSVYCGLHVKMGF